MSHLFDVCARHDRSTCLLLLLLLLRFVSLLEIFLVVVVLFLVVVVVVVVLAMMIAAAGCRHRHHVDVLVVAVFFERHTRRSVDGRGCVHCDLGAISSVRRFINDVQQIGCQTKPEAYDCF